MIDDLVAALVSEFDGEIIFAPWLPPSISPPAVVVAPGDPFLVPGTHGGVVETWRILVAVSISEPRMALDQIRTLSLRARKAAHSVGAVWRDSGAPGQTASNTSTVVSVTEIAFRYPPSEE